MRILALALLLSLGGSPAHAAYSGLTLIPTADSLAPGEVCLDYQIDGPYPVASGPDVALLNTQFGLGNRAEVGMDFHFTQDAPTGALFNGKLLLRPVEAGLGLALGAFNAGEHLSPTSYAAATLDQDRLRLHAGAFRTADETQGLAGFDYALNDRLQLWAEHIAGDENASAVSLAYQFHPHWGISFAWQHPNHSPADDTYSLHLGCVWGGG